jgi:hypothetical protein
MTLPEAFEDRFESGYRELERRKTMAETMPPLVRRARDRGRVEGIEQGVLRGKRETLLRQMEVKFGPLSETMRSRVERIADDALIDQLTDRILTAQTVAEMQLPKT